MVRYLSAEYSKCIHTVLLDSGCDAAIDSLQEEAFDNLVAAGDDWGFGTRVSYHCGLAQGFEISGSEEVLGFQEMECQWNGTWTPTDELGTCVCK